MKPYLMLVSHGEMAQATLDSAEMITGNIDTACAIGMSEQEGLNGFCDKLVAKVESLGKDREILVLADLYGGTPCNVVTSTLLCNPKVRLVAGMNLAMVIEYSGSSMESLDILAVEIAAVGKLWVRQVVLTADVEDDDEIEG